MYIFLTFAHFMADFVPQTSKVGLNKSKDERVLALHILIYTVCLAIFLVPAGLPLTLALLVGILHWPTDWITSRLAGKFYRENRLYAFWKVIAADQFVHLASLFWLYEHLRNV